MEILILTLIALAVLGALRYIKKRGPTCGGNCAACGRDCGKKE